MRSRRVAATICLLAVLLAVSLSPVVLGQGKYCGSKKSDVYHYPSCRYVDQIKPENLIWFKDEYDAVAKGYRPCQVCKPPLPGQVVTTTATTRTSTHTSVVSTTSTTRASTYTSISTAGTSSWFSRTESSTLTAGTATSSQATPTTSDAKTSTQSIYTSSQVTFPPPSTPRTSIEATSTSGTASPTTPHTTTSPSLDYSTLGAGLVLGVLVSLIGLGMSRKRVRVRRSL